MGRSVREDGSRPGSTPSAEWDGYPFPAQSVSPALAGISHAPGRHVSVDGVDLWTESVGAGPPVLLVAGGPGASHTYLHPLGDLIESAHRVVYFDAYGCGQSQRAKHASEYTLAREVDAIEGLRVALGLGAVSVVGHSYGAAAALAYAAKYPASVHRLVFANGFACAEALRGSYLSVEYHMREQYPEVWSRVLALRAEGRKMSDALVDEAMSPPHELLYLYAPSTCSKMVMDINNEVFYGISGDDAGFVVGPQFADFDLRDVLGALPMPALVLAGRYDRLLTPYWQRDLIRRAPRAKFVMCERSGHLPFLEEPELTRRVLLDFLA